MEWYCRHHVIFIVDAQAIGSVQEQQTLIPVIEAVEERFKHFAPLKIKYMCIKSDVQLLENK